MHHLFDLVLGQKDLSRAGDLFSLDDYEIESSLSEALEQIKIISSSVDYQTNDNDQAVVEICITRITTAIRETESIEKHGKALVLLWESCLEHNLKAAAKDEDTPHGKIASDIMSCILQNYNRPTIMSLAVPVAVKFLQRGNRELSRNLSSYISLAAIAKADLLVDHTVAIVSSVLQGNSMLLRVLPSVYEMQPQPVNACLRELVSQMPHLDDSEQHHLLRLLQEVAKQKQPQTWAKICLTYLVNQLTNMEHSFHHVLLMEIRNITSVFNNILGSQGRDMCRMSNSFTAIAKILNEHLQTETAQTQRTENHIQTEPSFNIHDSVKGPFFGDTGKEKSEVNGGDLNDQHLMNDTLTGRNCMYTDVKILSDDKKDKRVSRSRKLAMNSGNRTCMSLVSAQETENTDSLGLMSLSHFFLNHEDERLPSGSNTENSPKDKPLAINQIDNCTEVVSVTEPNQENPNSRDTIKEHINQQDKLFLHLKENVNEIRNYVEEMGRQVPVPDQCIIEDTVRRCVAKLFFSCPMKGHYCLYSKSSFTLISQHPQLWIHIMFLFQQSMFPEPLSIQSKSIQILKTLWEKTQLKGTHSFEASIIQSLFPLKKDLELVHMHLEEVRFFDLFGFSEETGSWQCFMCNNPEKATVVNQEGQPLIEGKLKEKQVRWKFIKRWKTRYFTLAGNQLLFRKGKSKDDPDDCPIELSKVQSVKVVAKKRRDRTLPRAFEIFTENKTYIFKAKDEKNAEEWLQCINVAVAQAKERESREATTYL
ncbi:ventricular zone-expressed PH domain-containing protein homolog 1 isoform X3 [Spea bombifrons]|uniref:ventricular zone-expressed PH domain-containing protein homolog 1 isoform X3 n=1 Tax=Spea bombifrons TaxID=233779 RepID=UPI0023499E42|nr:ventricular zone-expressed PH domain-containing protein homolog 1 isoform X3 [Spea bombifrons]